MKDKTGGPAFPFCQWYGDSHAGHAEGMTLRDWFAGQAMMGLLPTYAVTTKSDYVATWAYQYADAMLAERSHQ